MLDRWRNDTPGEEGRFRELAEFVELRAASPDEVETRHAYLDLMELRPGQVVLDAGCGTGVVSRDVAARLRPGGRVVGVEPNAYLLAEARRLGEEAGLVDAVEWRTGDARRLDFAGGSFDAVVCSTVLAHIPDSEPVVAELVRVLRPGGRIGIFEIDPESFVLNHPDRSLTRRILNAANDHGFANAWVSRKLPGLLEASGVEGVRARAFTSLERDPKGFLARAAELRPVIAERAGAISKEEGEAWLAALREEMQAGRFLAGTTYIFAWGAKA